MGYKRRTKAVLIAEQVLEAIKSGKYDFGGKLPSVRAQAKRFGVSDKTVRNAYDMLERGGHLCKRSGVGTSLAQQRVSA